MDEESGEVTVRVRGKVIIKVSKSGVITLNTDGMRTVSLHVNTTPRSRLEHIVPKSLKNLPDKKSLITVRIKSHIRLLWL